MRIKVTCPECRASQSVSDMDVDQTVRCKSCQAEFVAAAAAAPPPPSRASRRLLQWIVIVLVLAFVVLGGAALAAYLFIDDPSQTDFTDPNGIFSARFPDNPTETTVSEAEPLKLRWGERHYLVKAKKKEYSVAIMDGLNSSDQPYGPATREAHTNGLVIIAISNTGGKQLMERPADHEGHSAREVVFGYPQDGKLTALRVIAGEHYALRLTVTGPGDKDKPAEFLDRAAEFFNGVHLGAAFGPPVVDDPPAVTATDLAAAYQADARAADAQYKDRWLRVTGSVREVTKDKTEFSMAAGESVIIVKRAPQARMTVPIRGPGTVISTTAKCRGLGAAGPRVLLEDAIVARTPVAK